MSGSMGHSWNWPKHPSATAMKYLRVGYVSNAPFNPGDRYRLKLDMENKVAGYKELAREMRAVTEEIDYQRKLRSSVTRDMSPACVYRSSPMGYTTEKGPGNTYYYSYSPSINRFSVAGKPMEGNPRFQQTYRYFGMHRF